MYNPFRESIQHLTNYGAGLSVGWALYLGGQRTRNELVHNKAQEYVNALLLPCYSEIDWLISQGGESQAYINANMTAVQGMKGDPVLQAWRKEWLERMADDFDKGLITL